jgi:hypothetical protein
MPAQPGFGTSAASGGCRRAAISGETTMTKSGLLGAAAILAALVSTPALAQQAMHEPGAYLQDRPWANNYHYRYGRTGFWPGDVAAGIVGGTADVIVSAPFVGRDSYAYYGRGASSDDSYAYFNDRPVSRRTPCGLQSGATYMGPDGRWYPC